MQHDSRISESSRSTLQGPGSIDARPAARLASAAGSSRGRANGVPAGRGQDWRERRRQLQDAVDRHMIRYVGDFPRFFVERAEGAYFYDDSGRRLLDFTSGQMCATLGHNHPAVVAAIRRSCERAIHLFSWVLAPEVVELCRELAALLPPQLPEGDPPEHRQRGQRGGAPHGQARERPPRDRRARGLVPRPDRRGRGRDLLGRAARLRAGRAGQPRDPGAERLPLPDPPLQRGLRSRLPRGRLRAGRQPARRPARRGDRRADPLDRGRDRAAARLFPAPQGALRGARHAADPRRGADRLRPGRRQLRLRAGRRGAGPADGLEDARRRHPARRRGGQPRARGDVLRAGLRARHLARLGPAAGRGRARGARGAARRAAGRARARRWACASRRACATCSSATR